MIPQVLYTNSNCNDVWEMFLNENKKHTNLDLFVITDSDTFPNVSEEKIYRYKNTEPYWLVWSNALEKFGLNNFLYLQEDFILYDTVDDEKLTHLTEYLNTTDFSFIRLIKSGSLNNITINNNLFEIESTNPDIFSMQPTIWKTNEYIKIMKGVKEEKWLENNKYKTFMIQNNIKGAYYYNNEPKRGLNHHDSSIYPYIATALVRGKWNLSEYSFELGSILEKYDININKRGTI